MSEIRSRFSKVLNDLWFSFLASERGLWSHLDDRERRVNAAFEAIGDRVTFPSGFMQEVGLMDREDVPRLKTLIERELASFPETVSQNDLEFRERLRRAQVHLLTVKS